MRYLGIDYGAKRIGIAISDEKGGFAFPRETIPNDFSAIDRIEKIVKQERVGAIIIGDARAVNGVENQITSETEAFAKSLEHHIRIPVHTSWEAWSSVEAARFAPKGKEHDDAAAAAVILQRYLDTLHREEE
ncbi:hypothetical protein A2765_02490 [Candidatus Kaiserbacteria bacterium RIFCSPHIGHO2_01_FULL_56_24]|uniref:Putative pre-16S rRNA nuclease n=1 Tax=Candidatus Kaiserbacteria bacterium RIFCSPHIGHO2_01_FULL_56_24 TaxID=1798487 RepID=A0A1F6DAY1_9BACT|nr:MAG: hypothetical protein A2765_02490 [Candidatus Kaiserbacteria bacterium RIFCSPHIGHO2_01_FULL_56_24]